MPPSSYCPLRLFAKFLSVCLFLPVEPHVLVERHLHPASRLRLETEIIATLGKHRISPQQLPLVPNALLPRPPLPVIRHLPRIQRAERLVILPVMGVVPLLDDSPRHLLARIPIPLRSLAVHRSGAGGGRFFLLLADHILTIVQYELSVIEHGIHDSDAKISDYQPGHERFQCSVREKVVITCPPAFPSRHLFREKPPIESKCGVGHQHAHHIKYPFQNYHDCIVLYCNCSITYLTSITFSP